MVEQIRTKPCAPLEADLVLLHYGDLDDGARAELQSHSANCAGCSAYLTELATLLPLAVASDEPPQAFWMDYNRELRHKIDAAAERKSWWRSLTAIFQPGYVPAFATAAVVVLALTLTFGNGLWSGKQNGHDDELSEALPVAENLDFFRAMDVLDDLDLLELMGGGKDAA